MTTTNDLKAPQIGADQIELLERLSNTDGVSGNEGRVRNLVLEQVRPVTDNIRQDALGNLLVTRHGAGDGPRLKVMVAAHMDEVGLMLSEDEGDGIYRFEIVGGVDPRQLAGKPIRVGASGIPGVIGAKPIHLSGREEFNQAFSIDTLRIDIGTSARAKVGDWATFATAFRQVGPSLRGKAMDDRLGVATLIELVKNPPANVDLLAAFTVQEENGLRGAHVAAYGLQPDLALVLDCTPANDLPVQDGRSDDGNDGRDENFRYNTRLGLGPAIYLADRATLYDPRLVRWAKETGDALGIPYQFRQPGGGGTDAGAIHKQRGGIPTLSISVPGRYLHTAASIVRLSDWQNTLSLAYHALARLTPELLQPER